LGGISQEGKHSQGSSSDIISSAKEAVNLWFSVPVTWKSNTLSDWNHFLFLGFNADFLFVFLGVGCLLRGLDNVR
jgi:hypothetical protein